MRVHEKFSKKGRGRWSAYNQLFALSPAPYIQSRLSSSRRAIPAMAAPSLHS